MEDDESRRLGAEIARVTWLDLRQHALRGALFVVHPDAKLLEVGLAVASDDKAAVEQWLTSGQLARPSVEEHAAWEADLSRPFDFVIVQPFVLAQLVDN